MAERSTKKKRIIKYYSSNRKLYDTCESKHITLSGLVDLIAKKVEIKVVDHERKIDVTCTTILQALTAWVDYGGKKDRVFKALLAAVSDTFKKQGGKIDT